MTMDQARQQVKLSTAQAVFGTSFRRTGNRSKSTSESSPTIAQPRGRSIRLPPLSFVAELFGAFALIPVPAAEDDVSHRNSDRSRTGRWDSELWGQLRDVDQQHLPVFAHYDGAIVHLECTLS